MADAFELMNEALAREAKNRVLRIGEQATNLGLETLSAAEGNNAFFNATTFEALHQLAQLGNPTIAENVNQVVPAESLNIFHQTFEAEKQVSPYQFKVASKLWYNKHSGVVVGSPDTLPVEEGTEPSKWVAEVSEGSLAPTRKVDPTLFALGVTTYAKFKGKWLYPGESETGTFYPSATGFTDGKTVRVVKSRADHGVAETDDYKAVRLYFRKPVDMFSLLIVMPKREELDEFIRFQNAESLYDIGASLKATTTTLKFPKVKVNFEIDLARVIGDRVFRDVIDGSQHYWDAAGEIEINELGMSAEGYDSAGMSKRGMSPKTNTFTINRPFMYVLQHQYLPTPILSGKFKEAF